MEAGDDLFVVDQAEDEVLYAAPPTTGSAAGEPDGEAEAVNQIKGLIPLCTDHLKGPQVSAATFGYDIGQMVKRPWAEPGARLSDYFNYGFNEKSWRLYCSMQRNGESSLLANATETLRKLEQVASTTAAPAAAAHHGMPPGEAPAPDDLPSRREGDGGGYAVPVSYGGGGDAAMGPPYPHQPSHYRSDFHRPFHGGGPPHGGSYKTRLCQRYAEGHCSRGDQCNYAHGMAELRQSSSTAAGAAPPSHLHHQMPYADRGRGGYYPNEPRQNYHAPPFHGGGGAEDGGGVSSSNSMNAGGSSGHHANTGGGGVGFRNPPKRQRQDGGNIYEPQY